MKSSRKGGAALHTQIFNMMLTIVPPSCNVPDGTFKGTINNDDDDDDQAHLFIKMTSQLNLQKLKQKLLFFFFLPLMPQSVY